MCRFRAATVRERNLPLRAATACLCVPARRQVRERNILILRLRLAFSDLRLLFRAATVRERGAPVRAGLSKPRPSQAVGIFFNTADPVGRRSG